MREKLIDKLTELCRVEVLRLLPLNRTVLERAAAIMQACHPKTALRTLDALHVATCELHRCESLCATDRRLRAAGAQMGIQVFPSSLDEIVV
jgi:predicted nucleic acid-binding protein